MKTGFKVDRRTVLRGVLGGAGVTLGLPLLDCFLNTNGTALASGAPLPVVFGTWFWGCGFNPGRWEPKKVGEGYDMNIETMPLQPFRDRINVISGTQVYLDGKPAKSHVTGLMAIITGDAPRDTPEYGSLDSIVADQIGAPTWSNSISTVTAHIVARGLAAVGSPEWWRERSGIYHFAAGGETSWHGFAEEIFRLSLGDKAPRTVPIPASEYPVPAKRPANSRMSGEKLMQTFGLRMPAWDDALKLCLDA